MESFQAPNKETEGIRNSSASLPLERRTHPVSVLNNWFDNKITQRSRGREEDFPILEIRPKAGWLTSPMSATENHKGNLLNFLTQCGCSTQSLADIFHTNQSAVVVEVQVVIQSDDGEKILNGYSEGCHTIPQAEESAIINWIEMNHEEYPSLLQEPLNQESIKQDFSTRLTELNSSAKPIIKFSPSLSQFVCTIRVPLGDDSFSVRSRPFGRKKDAEADAAKKWMAAHKSIYEISSQMKGLLD